MENLGRGKVLIVEIIVGIVKIAESVIHSIVLIIGILHSCRKDNNQKSNRPHQG